MERQLTPDELVMNFRIHHSGRIDNLLENLWISGDFDLATRRDFTRKRKFAGVSLRSSAIRLRLSGLELTDLGSQAWRPNTFG